MVDLVFRLFRRRAGILVIIRALLVKVSEHCYDSPLLRAVAYHVALLLTEQALAIHLQLYLHSLGDVGNAVNRQFGFVVPMARRAATRLAPQFTGR
jgi:hypothetical protein